MRIALIPTGRMELQGLERCLGRLFPGHDFDVVESERDAYDRLVPFDGFTSAPLPTPLRTPEDPPSNLSKLVQAMAAELVPGRLGEAADLCVVLDDLELANVDRSERVVDAIRHEARLHVDELQRRRPALAPRVAKALLDRGSFHFAVPMIEAWLLADPASPGNLGIPPERAPRVTEGRDPEHFLVDDPEYERADDAECIAVKPRHRKRRPAWMRTDRARHPKAYLSWLCRDPLAPDCTSYRETEGGAAALRGLDWPAVVRRPDHMRFARSLVADLADALGRWPTTLSQGGHEATLTSIRHAPKDRVLRNM